MDWEVFWHHFLIGYVIGTVFLLLLGWVRMAMLAELL